MTPCDRGRKLQQLVAAMRPKNCCEKTLMVAGGEPSIVCTAMCQWQALDLAIATTTIDVALLYDALEREHRTPNGDACGGYDTTCRACRVLGRT